MRWIMEYRLARGAVWCGGMGALGGIRPRMYTVTRQTWKLTGFGGLYQLIKLNRREFRVNCYAAGVRITSLLCLSFTVCPSALDG